MGLQAGLVRLGLPSPELWVGPQFAALLSPPLGLGMALCGKLDDERGANDRCSYPGNTATVELIFYGKRKQNMHPPPRRYSPFCSIKTGCEIGGKVQRRGESSKMNSLGGIWEDTIRDLGIKI